MEAARMTEVGRSMPTVPPGKIVGPIQLSAGRKASEQAPFDDWVGGSPVDGSDYLIWLRAFPKRTLVRREVADSS
jgi:hypothetical protein